MAQERRRENQADSACNMTTQRRHLRTEHRPANIIQQRGTRRLQRNSRKHGANTSTTRPGVGHFPPLDIHPRMMKYVI